MSRAVFPVARCFKLTLEFYPLGSCNAGDACKFSHNLETAQDRQPCKYFQKGNCKFGAKCALLHIIDGRPVNDPVAQQINNHPPSGFQRQMPLVGNPQVSGLSSGLLGMQQLGTNQPPPPPTYQNGYHTQQQQSYFTPQSPTMNDVNFHSAISSQHNSPPSPPQYRSGLSSALRNHENEPDLPHSSSMSLLGPLDAPFPSSVDLTNNHIARHGPFAASVPSKFGIPHSGISSLAGSVRERVVTGDYPGSGTQSPVYGDHGSRYGSPIDSHPWGSQDFSRSGGSLFLQSIQQQRTNPTSPMHSRPQSSSSPFVPFDQKPTAPPPSRLNQLNRTRLTPISSSVPAAHFGEKGPFSPVPVEDEEALDPDALPSSLHDEVLLPQELNRRSSQSHTPGLNRRSSAYDEFARSPPSGAVTPGSERGGGSLAGSPGSSRMESLWGIKLPDDPVAEMASLNLSNNNTPSRQRVASPLRHPLETTFTSTTATARTTLKTPSVHAAQKWGGRTAEKLFPHVNGESPHAVNVPGVAWRRTGDITVGRGELSSEDVRRIKEEEEGTQFSME